jgi:PAS domain S-box-containing protein
MKQYIRWWHVIALIIIITGVYLTILTAQQQDQQLRSELLTKAKIAAENIDPAMLEALTGSPSDIASPDYLYLKVKMARIRNADPSIRFAYLLGQKPEGIFFYVDSEPADSEDQSPPGQVYTEATSHIVTAFSDKEPMTEGPDSDRWGTWVSAVVPVIDQKTGRLVALFGMDVDAKDWNYNIARACAATMTASLLMLVLVVAFGLMQQRHNQREQQRLLASEDKFYRAFHTNPALMAVSSIEDGRFLEVNSSFLKRLGYLREEVIGRTQSELGLYPDPAQWEVILSQLKETGQVLDVDVKVIQKNHDILNGSFSAITIDVAGLACLLTVILDITERKVAEETIRESEDRFRTIINSMLFGIVIIDAKTHTILEANPKALEMIGGTSESVFGSVCHCFICPAEQGRCPVTDLLQTVDSSERVLLNLRGERIPILKSVIKTMLGEKEVLIESFINISDRKLAEDTLQRVNQKLNVLSQLTRQDLTTQIFILNSYLEMAKTHATGHDGIVKNIESSERAVRSIKEITEFTKDYQNMGEKPPKYQNVKLSFLFGLSHISIGEIRHSLETENLEIFADPLLEKAFQGLLENSVEHGGHVSLIRVSHTVTPDGVSIIFEDDGVGISAEKKERIFLRGEGARASVRGLFFVQEILSITGIIIRENGEPGKGARFEMAVPKGTWRIAGKDTQ